jgi:hypothetical protein
MRLPIPPAFSLPLFFTAIILPSLPLLGSDGTDEPSRSSPAPAGLRMAPDTLDRTDPRGCVSQAAEIANYENLAGYLECCAAFSQITFRQNVLIFAISRTLEQTTLRKCLGGCHGNYADVEQAILPEKRP